MYESIVEAAKKVAADGGHVFAVGKLDGNAPWFIVCDTQREANDLTLCDLGYVVDRLTPAKVNQLVIAEVVPRMNANAEPAEG